MSRDSATRIPILIRLSEQRLKTNLVEAADYAEESLRLSEGLKNETLISKSLEALAKARYLQGRLDKAVESRSRLLILSRSRKDSLILFKSLTGMAAVHITLNESLRAQYLLDAASEIAKSKSGQGRPELPVDFLLEWHTACGNALNGVRDHYNADRHFSEGMRLAEKHGLHVSSYIPLLIGYGNLMHVSGRSDSAKAFFETANRLSRHSCDNPSESSSSWALGGLAEKGGDIPSARSLYAEAFQKAELSGAGVLGERSARSLAKAFQKLGIADSSLYMVRLAD